MGTGFKGKASHYHTIAENLSRMIEDFPYNDGYFGTKGNSSQSKIRHIYSIEPQQTAKIFYDDITYGGIENPIYDKIGNICGLKTSLADGSVVSWRNISHSADKSPAVDINIERSLDSGGIKQQKIHFIRRKI